jgi:DNA-binding GntR family transcriptional regulator
MKKLDIAPIGSRSPIPDLVLTRLRDAILEGQLPPGTRLKLDELASRMAVSHMPVRQALQHLVVEGLATHVPHRGVVVSTLRREDVISAYQVVGALEVVAVREAIAQVTPALLSELHDLLDQEQALLREGDYEALLRTNRAFHSRIFQACPNQWVVGFLNQLGNYTYRVRRTYPQSSHRIVESASEHVAMLRALEAGDVDGLERLVRQHNERARDDLLRQLAGAAAGDAAPAAGARASRPRPVPAAPSRARELGTRQEVQ